MRQENRVSQAMWRVTVICFSTEAQKETSKVPPAAFHAEKKKRSHSGFQSQSSEILFYVVVYVGLSTDVSKNYISFTFRIKQSFYHDGPKRL